MINNSNIASVLSRVGQAVRDKPLPIVTLHAQMQRDPFRVLVATMLSARTRDEVTRGAVERLFAVAQKPAAIARLSEERIATLIYPVGFYKTKARALRKLCSKIITDFKGDVPHTIEELVTLPGVGRKTANLVLIEGFRKPGMCVDTHVHRISNRWGYVRTTTPTATEFALRKKLPQRHWIKYNELLVGFGQHICQPVSPKCSTCPLFADCPRVGVKRSR